jgi:hypothetical protein
MRKKTLQIPVGDETLGWLNKGTKENKVHLAEFVRMVLDYHRDTNPTDFKKKAERAKIERLIKETEAQVELINSRKEQLAKQLEKIGA